MIIGTIMNEFAASTNGLYAIDNFQHLQNVLSAQ
jgi:hypothetical protein